MWFVMLGILACQPLTDSCEVVSEGDPVGLEEVGEPGFAPIDGLIPAGTFRVRDGGYDLTVTLSWADRAFPRTWEWQDGDGDGVVPDGECPMDYRVRGTLTVDSGDGRYDERGSADAVANESGGGSLWVTIDDRDVRGTEVPGKELWLEIFRDLDEPGQLRFGLTAIGVGGAADYLVDGVLEPVE